METCRERERDGRRGSKKRRDSGSGPSRRVARQKRALRWPRGQVLLDVLLANGLEAPYSCREGARSACTCRVVSGQVRMRHNEVLDDADLAEGCAGGRIHLQRGGDHRPQLLGPRMVTWPIRWSP
ncbi:2Fe-2S iron-sulfur cluster binding domain-containing protein [Nocardia sp. CDC186]|uniref:2Fe-2S iron-sulfur cluster binding domain-containing protein n=1 Tax=Nocardia implantans TaxID=3108168 RepID=A0ABU6ASV0_9NOCA|nr:2Fe-2S iron-sulfur cluster binding domain-containing protein [Nocardia sp. CDC186]